MLTLEKKVCKIGTSINTRRQIHGEEPVPAMDIPISEIMLERDELQAIYDDITVWDNWFDHRAGDKLPEPANWLKQSKPIGFADKFKDSQVILYVGLKPEIITLVNVKLARLNFEPKVGGLTAMSLTIQATPDMAKAAKIFDHMDHTAHIAIEIGERDEGDTVKNQPELPMTMSGGEIGTPEEERKAARAREKQIAKQARSAKPRGRKPKNGAGASAPH